MTQTATVTALPVVPGGQVELTIVRQTACGHSCDGCGRCAGKAQKLVIRAGSDIPVALGDQVEVYSDNRVLGAAALVYGLPVVLFLLGYLLPSSLPEPGRCLCGGLGFAMGLAGAAACDRLVKKRSGISYRIVRKL
jgi:sigma-E factor negative regulatory protein RseC